MSTVTSEPVQVVLPEGDYQDVDIFDVSLMLCQQCVEDAHVDVAGVMLTTTAEQLELVASSNDVARIQGLFELLLQEGPGVECFNNGPIVNYLFKDDTRWPKFAERAISHGFSSMHCIPMRIEEKTIGVLSCFVSNERWLGEHDMALVQDMADNATTAILMSQIAFDAEKLSAQLKIALESRVIIEQAKGIMSASLGGDIEKAFVQLRTYARNNNFRIAKVSSDVCDGALSPASILGANLKMAK